ncbi:MAG: pyridoxamine 5'-phosphate oxidase [Bacteroidales bacterium]|nr:pyridoxamine 5'-phosphate oxidase [Bacteroidales bacterium]
MKLDRFRHQYNKGVLSDDQLPESPIEFFEQWFNYAVEQKVNEVNAMVLSTSAHDKPSARVVLLKEVTQEGFVFFTNYASRKGEEIAMNPFGCLTFFWPELERQIRIEGKLHRISDADSDAYFNQRPEESRISAIVSPQSKVIVSRNQLEEEIAQFTRNKAPVVRPDYWGGYCLVPDAIEFWQGRPDRLNDRIRYRIRQETWIRERLAP